MPKASSVRLFVLTQEFKQDSIETDRTVIRSTICDSGILLDEKHQQDCINDIFPVLNIKRTRLIKQTNHGLYYEIHLDSVLQELKI
ncbi:hypothetical protein C0J52_14723 [Blattella germanica]|nr:hypothetical protein C0J52_14723 [Blattella germanica]